MERKRMNIEKDKGNLIVHGVKDFHLGQTLECGQCFHFIKQKENHYCLSAKGHFLYVSQNPQDWSITFHGVSEEDFSQLWREYFDLDRDYGKIKEALLARDDRLKEAMDTMWGVRILNQDFFETMISFIISQNKQIPHIKKIVWELSEKYGRKLEIHKACCLEGAGGAAYEFPNAEAVLLAGETGLRECKTGFRAPYIMAASKAYAEGSLNEEKLRAMTYEEALLQLLKIKGIGEKVANCILLFGLGKRNAFPVDVWIKRTMESIYIGHEADKSFISRMAEELFGEYGGYAQQYLFYFGKEKGLGKSSMEKIKK